METLGKAFCGNSNCRSLYFHKNNILTNGDKIRADEEKKLAETSDLINGIFYSKDHLAVNGAQGDIQNAKILDGVKTIKLKAFDECKKLRSIEIPETVSDIGAWAFSECSSLSSEVKLPSGLTKISEGLFYSTPISNITIPKKVNEIGRFAFSSTRLNGLVLPENVTKIQKKICNNTKAIKYVVMSSKVSEVEEGAFLGCGGVFKNVKTIFNVYMIGGKLSSSVKDALRNGCFAGKKDANKIVNFVEIKAANYDEGVERALKKTKQGG